MAHNIPTFGVITSVLTRFEGRFGQSEPEPNRGFVEISATDVFAPTVKMEFERATVNPNFIHFRFCYSNRYWSLPSPTSSSIVAVSDQKNEDTSQQTCTLFEPVFDAQTATYSIRFVHNGRFVRVTNGNRRVITDNLGPGGVDQFFRFNLTEWDTFIKLPKYITFRGHNNKFLKPFTRQGVVYHSFSSDESNDRETAYEVIEIGDGHVRIRPLALETDQVLRRNRDDWIGLSIPDRTRETLFWPVKVGGRIIALRSAGNDRICRSLTQGNMTDCLTAQATGLISQSRLTVSELVMGRRIYDVVYHMDNARIYGHRAVVTGSGRSTNSGTEEATQTISISFTDTSSYTFSNSNSLSTGVTTSVTAGFGSIVSMEVGIQISSEQTVSVEVGEEVSRSVTTETSYTTPVPPMSTVIVNYVATEGKCDIPFSYTQRDQDSVDGSFRFSNNNDGVYTGVNYFSFHFEQPQFRSLQETESD
ncbi:uncharacterized protein LOC126681288 [Mercurialis annua]|uniref:uncharacterized protein LOC126681288 n=1 Tax=Mercurialis annua TaxID=3986 RepID=UPI00215FD4A7|nr:uncharacterized protein LOC126681288 [Mercurialis annua]